MQGKVEEARVLFRQTLAVSIELGHQDLMIVTLEGQAALAVAEKTFDRVVRLAGAAIAQRKTSGRPAPPVRQIWHERMLDAAHLALGEFRSAAIWAEGQAMTLEQAVAYALEEGGC